MEKEIVSDRQGICLVVLFILGSTLIIGLGGIAKQDAWIVAIIGIVAAIPIVTIYSRLLHLFPNKDLFDILQIIFGNFLGKILCIIYIWFAFHLSVLVIRNLSEFTSIQMLPRTPVIVPMIFFIGMCIFGLKSGIEVLGRWAEYFILVELALIILVSIGLSISKAEINNLLPVFYKGIKPIVSGVMSAIAFPFAESIIFTMIPPCYETSRSPYKIYIMGLIIGGIIILITTLRNILILGGEGAGNYYFPSFTAVRTIEIGEFIQRVELSVVIVFLIDAFMKISMAILAVCNGISKIFNINDYKFIVTPIALLSLGFSTFIYSSTMEMSEWAFMVWPYYAIPFQVILPAIILVAAEIKVRKAAVTKNV